MKYFTALHSRLFRLAPAFCLGIGFLGAPLWAQDTLLEDKSIGELVAVLNDEVPQSGNPTFTKAMACRQLAIRGDATAVTALKKHLGSPELSTYARDALESIPDPEASRALRDATSGLDGDLLIGTLGSLGRLRDVESLPLLTGYLNASDANISAAAARTLGSIGTPAAGEILLKRLKSDSSKRRHELGWALIDCAMRCDSESNREFALTLLAQVIEQDVSTVITNAARQHAIPMKGERGLDDLRELLASKNETEFSTAIQTARGMGQAAAEVLVDAYSDLGAQQRIIVLDVLNSNPSDTNILPLLKAAMQDEHAGVRSQACLNLGQQLTQSAVPFLIQGLGDANPEVAQAATQALVAFKGPDVEPAIQAILEEPGDSRINLAIEVAAGRRLHSAPPALFMILDSEDTAVADAAMEALGSTITLRELPRVLERVQDHSDPRREAALRALNIACARLPREACATVIAEALEPTEVEETVALLEQLTLLGGEKALQTVAATAVSNNEMLRDHATRLLGTWPTSDVAPVLATLASEMPEGKYKVRVIRGYIRVARQLDLPLQGRIDVCRRALGLAQRVEDKQLVLDVLKRYPTPAGITVAGQLLQDPTLSEQAIATASHIAQAKFKSEPWAVAAALELAQEVLPERRQNAFRELLTSVKTAVEQQENEDGFVPIFDGKTFKGWHGNQKIFRIADGEIVGGNLKDRVERNEFLRTDQQYENFELRLQFKLLGESPNAGVQIRTQEIPDHHEVSGYQADLGPGWWGCLYDESRRNRVLAGPPAEERGTPVRVNAWNDYRILCEGKRIRLWINGVPTVDYTESDDDIPLKGIIAVQVHSGAPMEARYKNLRIRVLQ